MNAIEQLIIENACHRLSIDFCSMVDRHDYTAINGIFTEDCIFNRTGTILQGREALREWLEGRPVDVRTRHVSANIYVDVVDKTYAVGGAYTVLYSQAESVADSEPVPLTGAAAVTEFKDRYVLAKDGWKIAARQASIAFLRSPS